MLFELHKVIGSSLYATYGKFLKNDILFDTAPLFLYLAGSYDNKNGTNLLRLFGYTPNDYQLLSQTIHLLKKSHVNFVITPHILHEIIKHIQDDCKKNYSDRAYCEILLSQISEFIKPILREIKEINTKKDDLIEHPYFLGEWEIGDISIDVIDKEKNECSMIITDDNKIKEEYEDEKNKDVLVIFFTDLRNNAPLLPK